MIPSLIFKEEARDDILHAAKWYRERQLGLDVRFLGAVEEATGRIVKQPTSGRMVYKSFRQTSLKKFSYVIVYEIFPGFLIIYSVFHTRQNPKKKLKRLKQ
jgi:plasmid stabilization system protein ParE